MEEDYDLYGPAFEFEPDASPVVFDSDEPGHEGLAEQDQERDEDDGVTFPPEEEDEVDLKAPVESVDIRGLMEPGGLFERTIPGYRYRPQQLELATSIEQAIATPRNLMAEAPTGTGKSIAALIPLIAHAHLNAQRAVYVTGTKLLQEQLARKDLPALASVLPWPFRAAVMKGVGNYLCLLALERAAMDPQVAYDEQVVDLHRWAEETDAGDLDGYDVELSALVRSKVTTTSDECVGLKCPKREQCFLLKARRAAAAANVVVVNYHLFFADLSIKLANNGRGILPAYQNVLLDEGHGAANIARGFFGFELSPGSIGASANRLMRYAPREANNLKHAGEDLFGKLEAFRKSDRYRARLIRPLEIDWRPVYDELRFGAKVVTDESAKGGLPEYDKKKLVAFARTLDSQANNLLSAAELKDPDFVYHLPDLGKRGTGLGGMPLKVDTLMRQALFQSTSVRSVVVMSATLTASGSFELISEELGSHGAALLEVESPFDWKRNALAIVPHPLPGPKTKEWEAAALAALVDAIDAARGRTLGLFTSWRTLQAAAAAVRAVGLPYTLYVQGELPRGELVRRFREDVSSVLLGTASLWEGVDIQGESLSCVVIDKLPFESPDDPIADAMRERRPRDNWNKRALPEAQLKFRQGCGRLLRTVTDRGVIVVLDNRIVTERYGPRFLPGGLPDGVRFIRGRADWAREIERHLDAPAAP